MERNHSGVRNLIPDYRYLMIKPDIQERISQLQILSYAEVQSNFPFEFIHAKKRKFLDTKKRDWNTLLTSTSVCVGTEASKLLLNPMVKERISQLVKE